MSFEEMLELPLILYLLKENKIRNKNPFLFKNSADKEKWSMFHQGQIQGSGYAVRRYEAPARTQYITGLY